MKCKICEQAEMSFIGDNSSDMYWCNHCGSTCNEARGQFRDFDQPATLEPRPIDDYHEDIGPALWWKFPICEPPYAGSPLDLDWPGYHTHWTPIVCPKEPA